MFIVYTWAREKRHEECEVYGSRLRSKIHNITRSRCLFYKSHEPWWHAVQGLSEYSVRGVLLLRHPYDAAFSEYKR